MSNSESAIAEWRDTHKYSQGWEPIAGGYANGEAFVVLRNEEKIMPYIVEYRKEKKYFTVLADAVQYIRKQRWDIPEEVQDA